MSGKEQCPPQQISTVQDSATLIENISDFAIFTLDLTGHVVSWNVGAERIMGYRVNEMVGKHFSCFYTDEDDSSLEKLGKSLDIAAREGRYAEESVRVRKDDSLFWANVIIAPLHDESGQLHGFSQVLHDVTALHLAHTDLADISYYTQKILDAAPIGIMTLKDSGEFVAVNPAICRLVGATREQLIGLNYRQLESWRSSGLLALAEEALATRAPSHGEVRAASTFGKNLCVRVQFLTFDHKGELHLLGLFEDISESKQAQLEAAESEGYLRAMFDAAPFGAHRYEISSDGRLVMTAANRAAKTILRTDHSEMIGRTPEEAFPALAGTELPASYRRVAETGVAYHEDRTDYIDGSISGSFELDAVQTGRNGMTVFFRKTSELTRAYEDTLEGWAHAMEYRDKDSEGHTRRVTEMTIRLARALGISGNALLHIRWGALIHDLGKMAIPDSILLKQGPLTQEEWAVMRKHPEFAYRMLSSIRFLEPALEIPYCHHEKWDGTGYPRGLKGDVIPLSARIFAVADVWDALRFDRPYRESWSSERVTEHIVSLAGTHFDPRAVEAFRSLSDWR